MITPQKPGDHPDFFRFRPPDGHSRESSIVLDINGEFWHEGARVENDSMKQAFARWIRRHPDDGRYILSNGYDWTYFQVEDTPYFVHSLRVNPRETPRAFLSDGSDEELILETLAIGARDAIYCRVKLGEFEARFSPSAQTAIAPLLEENENGIVAVFGGRSWPFGLRAAHP